MIILLRSALLGRLSRAPSLSCFPFFVVVFIVVGGVFCFMRSVSFRVPEEYLRGLEVLVGLGVFRSRSEAVRAAVKELLQREGVFEEEEGLLVIDAD